MNIVFHAHRADMPESLQQRAEQAVQKLAGRLRRAVDASVRFAEDGPIRRVEIVLRAPRQQPLVAAGSGRVYETALGEALERLESHIAHLKAANLLGVSAPELMDLPTTWRDWAIEALNAEGFSQNELRRRAEQKSASRQGRR